jgi:hypothetical protein
VRCAAGWSDVFAVEGVLGDDHQVQALESGQPSYLGSVQSI